MLQPCRYVSIFVLPFPARCLLGIYVTQPSFSSPHTTTIPTQFELPKPDCKAGGACTYSLLQVLYPENHAAAPMSWAECLSRMRTELTLVEYDQIPELTSSRPMDVNTPMYIVPPGSTGRRRAVLIGINYTGQHGELVRACNNCNNDTVDQ